MPQTRTPEPIKCHRPPRVRRHLGADGLVAHASYTFGDAVAAGLELEWWLDERNPYHLKAPAKRMWVAAIVPLLFKGARTLPTPAQFGVDPHWRIDVLERAREKGLPF